MIAVHSTALGPAAGGCRFWRYPDKDRMITDATRLAKGMKVLVEPEKEGEGAYFRGPRM